MNAELTNKSQEALSSANGRAVSAGHPDLTPAHLLSALLEAPENDNLKDLLTAVGADPEALRQAVAAQLAGLPTIQGSTVAPPQANRDLLAVIAEASAKARELGDSYVSTEHLLIGLAAKGGPVADLLGRQGGLTANLDLGWRLRQTPQLEWTVGGGLSAGDASHMRSYFGVTPQGAAATGLPVYTPGGGLRDAHAGVGWTWQWTPRWIAFGSAGGSLQLGPAADSPLTQRRLGASAAVGLAYRN